MGLVHKLRTKGVNVVAIQSNRLSFGAKQRSPHCVLIFSYYYSFMYSATEIYGGPKNHMVKSCEIWHTGRGHAKWPGREFDAD